MYRHILLPTDGSALSQSAVESGIQLAKAVGAQVTGLHVTAKIVATPLDAWILVDAATRTRLKAIFDEQSKQYLAVIEAAAKAAKVRCACLRVTGDSPAEEIVKTAAAKRCDLIFMASHGKAGTSALLLGSETAKVLAHSPVPVLVYRAPAGLPIATRFKPALRSCGTCHCSATPLTCALPQDLAFQIVECKGHPDTLQVARGGRERWPAPLNP
jgi:nucleotide-binding universal stress UspA family protein